MRVDLDRQGFAIGGEDTAVSRALAAALLDNGAAEIRAGISDILILSLPLCPGPGFDWSAQKALAREAGAAMQARGPGEGRGRILFLLSAAAALPLRRFPDYSADMAAALAFMRALAMQLAPEVRVNALGAGLIGDPPLAGDPAMLRHAALGRPGTISELVDAALFLLDPRATYLTGQMLSVDGSWSVGYGRNF